MAALGTSADRSKGTRRTKQDTARRTASDSKTVPAQPPAAPALTTDAESSHRLSPTRMTKQQKVGGEAVLLSRCAAVRPEANWNISPPLGRVQECHFAFNLREKSRRSRCPSSLQSTSKQLPGLTMPDVKHLIDGVAAL